MVKRNDSDAKMGFDEGSWAYLIASKADDDALPGLRESLMGACEENGWPAVDGSLSGSTGSDAGLEHPPEEIGHAVRHADLVLAVVGSGADATSAELAFAVTHGRPIVGLRISGDAGTSVAEEMLRDYARVRMVECDDLDSCSRELHTTLSDPGFAEIVRLAATGGET